MKVLEFDFDKWSRSLILALKDTIPPAPKFYIGLKNLYILHMLQGDRMWQFAVGLYLVYLNDGQLRLAAVFGFTCSGLILLLGGLIGNWVDRNSRLKGTMIQSTPSVTNGYFSLS